MFPNFEEGLFKILSVITFSPAELYTPSLLGTRWRSNDKDDEITVLEFLPNETVAFTEFETRYTDGSWKQAGSLTYFELNGKYAQYRGKISGDTMSGDAQNISGLKWGWSAHLLDNAK